LISILLLATLFTANKDQKTSVKSLAKEYNPVPPKLFSMKNNDDNQVVFSQFYCRIISVGEVKFDFGGVQNVFLG